MVSFNSQISPASEIKATLKVKFYSVILAVDWSEGKGEDSPSRRNLGDLWTFGIRKYCQEPETVGKSTINHSLCSHLLWRATAMLEWGKGVREERID